MGITIRMGILLFFHEKEKKNQEKKAEILGDNKDLYRKSPCFFFSSFFFTVEEKGSRRNNKVFKGAMPEDTLFLRLLFRFLFLHRGRKRNNLSLSILSALEDMLVGIGLPKP